MSPRSNQPFSDCCWYDSSASCDVVMKWSIIQFFPEPVSRTKSNSPNTLDFDPQLEPNVPYTKRKPGKTN